MNPEELRIGNLVNIIGLVETKITAEHILGISNGDNTYKPIPLTEEWLEKFGFEKDDTPATFKKYNNHLLSISFSKTDITEMEINKSPEFIINTDIVKYVHQLQNLYFALTGEELKQK